jgi:hypothetical protein
MHIAPASRAFARIKAAARQARLALWEVAGTCANFVPANAEPVQLLAALTAAAAVGTRGILRRMRPATSGTSLPPLRRSHDAEKEIVST